MKSILTVDNAGNKYWKLPDEKLYGKTDPVIGIVGEIKYWFVKGMLHRTDGPAVEYVDGTKIWFLNGKQVSEQEWKIETRNLKLQQLSI